MQCKEIKLTSVFLIVRCGFQRHGELRDSGPGRQSSVGLGSEGNEYII